jgi:hypothetical protein
LVGTLGTHIRSVRISRTKYAVREDIPEQKKIDW